MGSRNAALTELPGSLGSDATPSTQPTIRSIADDLRDGKRVEFTLDVEGCGSYDGNLTVASEAPPRSGSDQR